jgi:hypothetical protein
VVENDGCLHWLERGGNKKGKVMTFFVYFFLRFVLCFRFGLRLLIFVYIFFRGVLGNVKEDPMRKGFVLYFEV